MTRMKPDWDITALYEEGGVMEELMQDMLKQPNAYLPATLSITPDSYIEVTDWITLLLVEVGSHPRVENLIGWYPLYALSLQPEVNPCDDIFQVINGNCVPITNFPQNDSYLATDVKHFLETDDQGKYFQGDVIYAEDMSKITTSRLMFQLKSDWSYDDVIQSYEDIAKIIDDYTTYNVDAFIFNIHSAYYISNSTILWQTLLALGIGGPVICFIVWCILQHLQATSYVLAMMILTDVDMIGLSYWMNIDFDFWFGLCVLVALGITVDFNIHITHRALELIPDYEIEDQWKRNVEHTRAVLYSVGGSVFHGTFSTIVCVLPGIFLSPMRQIKSLQLKLFLILFTGMVNGLIVLPCLITVFPIVRDNVNEIGKNRALRSIHRVNSISIYESKDEGDSELQMEKRSGELIKSFERPKLRMSPLLSSYDFPLNSPQAGGADVMTLDSEGTNE